MCLIKKKLAYKLIYVLMNTLVGVAFRDLFVGFFNYTLTSINYCITLVGHLINS